MNFQENNNVSLEDQTKNVMNSSPQNTQTAYTHFVGFWKRVAVASIDMILFVLANLFLGGAILFLLLVVNIVLYFWKGMTFGDFIMRTRLVDKNSLQKPSGGQLIGRFFAKILSTIPLYLGFLWAGWDREKRSWHDGLSGTRYVEIKTYNGGLTWLANILFLVILPFFMMQPLIEFAVKTLVPIGQGVFEGDSEKELEGVNSFGDIFKGTADKEFKKTDESDEEIKRLNSPKLSRLSQNEKIDIDAISKKFVEKILENDLKGAFAVYTSMNEAERKEWNKKLQVPEDFIFEDFQSISDAMKKVSAQKSSEKSEPSPNLSTSDFSSEDMITKAAGGWSNYYKKDGNIYYKKYDEYIPIEVDLATFEIINSDKNSLGIWARDKNHVFGEFAEIVFDANPKTTEVLSDFWIRDDKSVFYGTEKTMADRDSFFIHSRHYAKDKNSVYREGNKLVGVDSDTFEIVEGKNNYLDWWIKDRSHIYYAHTGILLVEEADVATFKIIESQENRNGVWSKDKSYIFFKGRVFVQADFTTFEILENGTVQDKNYIYDYHSGNIKSKR